MLSFDFNTLRAAYAAGGLTPTALVEEILRRTAEDPNKVWIHRLPEAALRKYAASLEGKDPASLPLYGIPFAIKDNIDLAGVPTTAACPAYAFTPDTSAFVVQKLIEAGAIPVGKTNLDQFATGLNGTRSPYGACRNAFDPAYVSGGSSSGSAVAVAKGYASFSLGTDTAGSGRVPAAFNNLVGHKPSCGWLSTTGVVPACRSLDAVSIFALTAADAEAVLAVAASFDAADPYARAVEGYGFDFGRAPSFKFGVPRAAELQFFGDTESERIFRDAVARLEALGGEAVEIDLSPFLATAKLLYEGPWVAERYQAIREFFDATPEALFPVTREITASGLRFSAADTFAYLYKLKAAKRECDAVWASVDCIVTPTAPTIYTIAQMEADPIKLNSNLGYYTNFMNLLDYAATAVPGGFRKDGQPLGVTIFAPAAQDAPLLHLAAKLHGALPQATLGATGVPLAVSPAPARCVPCTTFGSPSGTFAALPSGQVRVAVCGAHLSGLPLNWQLTSRGGRLVAATQSSPDYKLYALPGGPPLRPGMVRVTSGGAAITVEVWELPAREFGSFVAGIPAPLGIGTITLADGSAVQGFVCEAAATAAAEDITTFGGWRAWLAQRSA
ncbi:allophanate hydrolase [Sulfurisoma sediminicola]|uniref:Allophanate hydrolase n=1 Tax=Sulfurisoma sediminicola TaxID=1381557 RepID=A0A497XDX4_9PROT|nr:allophanate hydrolase [Sulfurisoma sediminicola]RLJ64914.1 allophanate hydrolase [Sulfurisoma sediminicola]